MRPPASARISPSAAHEKTPNSEPGKDVPRFFAPPRAARIVSESAESATRQMRGNARPAPTEEIGFPRGREDCDYEPIEMKLPATDRGG